MAAGWLIQDHKALNPGSARGIIAREVKTSHFEQMEGRGTRVLTPSEM